MKVKAKVIVVTGAGSGMGRELTLQLLKKGAKVALADIDSKGMEETVSLAGDLGKNTSVHPVDVSNKAQVFDLPDVVIKDLGQVDGIINNAGIIQPFVPVTELGFDHIERIMNINFYGTLYMIKAFLPHLLQRPEAHIANVASMGGFIPFPGQTLYSASKGGIKMLTEGLHSEMRKTNVRVTLILPGAVNTNIMKNSGLDQPKSDDTAKSQSILNADQAAKIMINAIENNKYRILVGKDARMLDMLYRLNPAWATGFIAKQMEKRTL